MSSFYQRLVDCKALVWAILGVFLLGFGSLGLTTCTDDSHRIAQEKQLRITMEEQGEALESQRTAFAGLEEEKTELSANLETLRGERETIAAERDTLGATLGAVSAGLAAIGIDGVTADTAPTEAVDTVAQSFASLSDGRSEMERELAEARTALESMEEERAQIADENARTTSRLQSELDSMRGAMDDADLEAQRLREDLKSALATAQGAETALAALTAERDDALASAEAARDNSKEMQLAAADMQMLQAANADL